MNALWIIDLTESQNAIKAFYDSFWQAFLDNQKDPNYPVGKREPWFHISTPEQLGLTINDNDSPQDISDKIYSAVRKADNLINPQNGMIKYDFANQNELNRILVILIGDTNTTDTQRFFLPLATSLKYDTQQPTHWNPTGNVYFYGMLYRRQEVASGNFLQDNEKAFLNQMHNIQNVWNTFNHVLFFEKPETQKDEAIKNMALASLHLAFEDSHDHHVLRKYENRATIPTYLNAGASGIYFEREVENDREAFVTGHTLLDAFVNSTDKEFYNLDAAKERAKNISVFKNNELDEHNLYRKLSANMPELDTKDFDVEMPISPGSPQVRKVWPRYYDSQNGYIANVKAKLVNNVKLALAIHEHEYLKQLANNQLDWIKAQSAAIENGIFDVFDDEHPDTHCSMNQAIEVAKQAEILAAKQTLSIENIRLEEDGLPLRPIKIPKRYQKAYDTAQINGEKSTQAVLNELDKMLRRHPVFMFSTFSRALLIAIILFAYFLFISPIAAAILFVAAIAAYFVHYRWFMNNLRSLQDRYVAISLYELNNKLLLNYKNAIHKSQSDIRDYCKWNWEKRLAMLRNNLGVFIPKSYHFEPFDEFQPLLTDNLIIDPREKFQKVVRNDEKPNNEPLMKPGAFDDIALLKDLPNFDVALSWSANSKSVLDLDNADKQRLIYDLMKQTAQVPQRLEENLDPAKMVVNTGGSVTLMLDVSGSMCGKPLDDLKQAVNDLKDKFGDSVRWVAFASQATLDTDVDNDIDKAYASCGGGTAYVPALDLLMTANQKGQIELEKLVIISDGEPFDVEESRNKILELGCEVDVIYIGNGNEAFLKELAESTGGTLQQVDDVKSANIQTVVAEGIATSFKLGQAGNFPFGDLLRKSALKECMLALLIFTKDIMVSGHKSIEATIADNGNNAGLINWLQQRAKICTTNPGAVLDSTDILLKSSGIEQERMCQMLQSLCPAFSNNADNIRRYKLVTPVDHIGDKSYSPDSPDILLTQLHIQPLKGIGDLAWSFDAFNDKQINSDPRFDMLFRSYFNFNPNYTFVNIFNQPIA
ncbi:MAG: hypothetical protein IJK07_09965 [Bacteroidales bacterium]|nr:hypothetical protein [Bacteroidales bacterium]